VAAAHLNDIVHHLRRAGLLRDDGLTDVQLLERFVARRDGAAFEALVHRHGPMVHGVCYRILRNHHDADDAFQATFLVLAHKAAAVVPRRLVGNWLYGVACNTALKARADARRRRAKEREAAAMPRPEAAEEVWRQLEPLLDGALHSLPDKYRVPIVLCDLEGLTRKEAARQLGCPEGTIASRLARARDLLAKRLARHGLVLSAAALAVALSHGCVSAGVSRPVAAAMAQAGALIAAGQTVPAGIISTRAQALKEGVLRAMLMRKLKIASSVLLVLVFACVAATLSPRPAPAQDKQVAPPETGTGTTAVPPKEGAAQKEADPPGAAPGARLILKDVQLDEVDVRRQTISVTVAGSTTSTGTSSSNGAANTTSGSSSAPATTTKLVGLPVAKDAPIMVGKQPGKLNGLRAGMRLVVTLAVEKNQLVVVDILQPGPQSRAAARAAYEVAQAKLASARANLEVAVAQAAVARAALEKAKADGKMGAELARIEAEGANALANETLARQVAEEAQVQLAEAKSAYESIQRDEK
jgi:RNA polymerase sigma factor (sigma-70 family)